MQKMSASNVQHALRVASEKVKEAAAELAYEHQLRKEAEKKLAEHELEDRLHKIAEAMDRKGLMKAPTIEDQVAELRQPENLAQLDAIEKGVDFAAQGVKLAHIEPTDSHGVPEMANEAEARFIASLTSSM